MLKIEDLHSFYGAIEVLHGVSMEVGDDEIVALIGSNGAGKTTLLRSVSGLIKRRGLIEYGTRDISGIGPQKVAQLGLLHVPEGRHVFPGLTVEQNLIVGSVVWRGLRGARLDDDFDKAYTLFPRLKERRKQLAWSLSGGEQQMLAIGRAIMGRPKMLMLDEPSMGLAPIVIDELFETIVNINKMGTPVLLVEQNAQLAMETSKTTYIIEQGKILISGPSQDLVNDSRVVEAYLGKMAE